MTIYYIDPTSGADQNGGNAIADGTAFTPAVGSLGLGVIYKDMATAYGVAGGSGHTFAMRRGYFHNPVGNVFLAVFIQKTDCIIRDYGASTAALPVLDGYAYQSPTAANAALWTHSGGGVWYYEPPGASGRCRLVRSNVGYAGDSKTDRPLGDFERSAATLGDVSLDGTNETGGIWYGATSGAYRITMYTGSTTIAPPIFFNGLAFAQAGYGVSNGISFRNSAARNKVMNLQIRGCATSALGAIQMTTGGVDGILFKDIVLEATYGNWCYLVGNGASGYTVKNVEFNNIQTNSYVTGPRSTDTPTIDGQNDDIFNFQDAVYGTKIINCEVNCSTVHAAFNTDGDATYSPRQLLIYNCVVNFTNSIDGRCFGLRKLYGGVLARIKIRGPSTKSQLGGQDLRVIGCDFGPLTYNSDSTNQRFLLEITNFAGDPAPRNVIVAHNVFSTLGSLVERACIGINTYSTSTAGVIANTIAIVNNFATLELQDGFVCTAPYDAAAQVANPISNQNITNNYVTRSDGAAALATTGNSTGTLQSNVFTANQPLNGFIGSVSNIGATLGQALVTVDNVPLSGSPLLLAGVNTISMTDSFGLNYNFGYCRDFNGVVFNNPPSIGAYEKTYTRTARV